MPSRLTQSVAAIAPPVIREAPPAPEFTEEERHAELRARRERVMAKLGPNSLLVLFSTEPRVYTNDVDYKFRQENNLYYLTTLRQEGATLVMVTGAGGAPREILFLPRRNPAAETWMDSPAQMVSAGLTLSVQRWRTRTVTVSFLTQPRALVPRST